VGEVDRLGVDAEHSAKGGYRRRPVASPVFAYPGRRIPGHTCFPRHWRVPRTDPGRGGGRKINPRAVRGAQRHCRGGGSKCGSPRVGGHQARSSRAGFVGPPVEEVPGALQDVSPCPRSLCRELFSLFCLLILVPSSHRYVYIGILSLTSLKRLALSERVVPSEPRP
jgi:hypothetical protein